MNVSPLRFVEKQDAHKLLQTNIVPVKIHQPALHGLTYLVELACRVIAFLEHVGLHDNLIYRIVVTL